jgi:nucleoid DNA-binding protein
MGKRSRWALAGLLAFLVLAVSLAAEAQTAAKPPPLTLTQELAKATKQKEAVAAALLKALGPALKERLVAGGQVELAGVGVFRVVRVPEYKDLVNGRPATVAARNYVEFLPLADLDAAANAPGVVPARTANNYEFTVNPNSTPGLKTGATRTPRSRTR